MTNDLLRKETQAEEIARLEAHLQGRLGHRVRRLRLLPRGRGVVLHGYAPSYHAKLLAQDVFQKESQLPLMANDIEVR